MPPYKKDGRKKERGLKEKMVKVSVTLVILFALSTTSMASFVEVDHADNCTTFQVCVQQTLKSKGLGAFVYQLSSQNWSEAYAGLTYSPIPQVELALGYGQEEAQDPHRVGGWVWVGEGRTSAIYLFEDGGSGPWHKLELKYQATDKVSFGYVERTYSGKGCLAEYRLTKGEKLRLYSFDEGTSEISLIHYF